VSKVCLISDQPVLRSGFARVLENQGFEVAHGTMETLRAAGAPRPDFDLALVDVTSGLSFESLAELNARLPGCPVVLWSDALPLDLVFRTLEFGVRGLVPRTAAPDLLVSSLKKVANGEMQIGFASPRENAPAKRQVALTPREREIVMRLRQGLRNKQIATEMNITEGTVKIYLFRLFHKLGVRNRFELASYGGLDNPQFQPVGAHAAFGPQLVEPAV
jgi:DNA-binding NarL/FixJ family response regulator